MDGEIRQGGVQVVLPLGEDAGAGLVALHRRWHVYRTVGPFVTPVQ